jgi:cytochrome P450
MKSYAADMVACAQHCIQSWTNGETIALARETTQITMSIAAKTLFGADTFAEADDLVEALTVALEWTASNAPSPLALAHIFVRRALLRASERLPMGSSLRNMADRLEQPVILPFREGRRLKEALLVLDERVHRMIEHRRSGHAGANDLLAKLVRARDEDDGGALTDKQLRDEVLTLFVAGHETTASALAWTVHCLCKNPSVYEATQREVDALRADPTFEDLPNLALTLRVFKEALRLYPPVYMFGREACEDTTLAGHFIPRHAVVYVAPYALHRRPDVWPDPRRFDPDRFLPDREASRAKLAWLPFGTGPRTCIGAQFALMEGQLVLATLLRRASFTAIGDEVPAPSATLRPAKGMPMRVVLRDVAGRGTAFRGTATR